MGRFTIIDHLQVCFSTHFNRLGVSSYWQGRRESRGALGKSFHSRSARKSICCSCAFIVVILGVAESWFVCPVPDAVCFADKLQPMSYALLLLSYTKWLHLITEELA